MEQTYPRPNALSLKLINSRAIFSALLAVVAAALVMTIGTTYRNLAPDAPLLTDSTLAELAVWMSDQSEEDAPPSILGSWAKQWGGEAPADVVALTEWMQNLFLIGCVITAALIGAGTVGLIVNSGWTRGILVAALLGMDALLFLIPTVEGDGTLTLVLISLVLMLTVMLTAPGKVTKFIGFMVAISSLLVVWEASKSFAASVDYAITTPQAEWEYTTYPTLEDGLTALGSGEIKAIIADRNAFEELMPPYPEQQNTPDDLPYPDLRYLTNIQRGDKLAIFPIQPEMPGRLSIAVRAEEVNNYTKQSQLLDAEIGAVEADFAIERYLALPREVTLLNLKIFNDLNLPHLQNIAEAFLQPARRNGEFLLMRILSNAALFTLREAVLGFSFGVLLGLLLGTIFAHSKLMERALLPYVVASQTVPILAIAPMVVIWLGASYTSVAVIAAYITFFPVAINTLRGLQSPAPTQVELMHSYAASWWTILWKLRFPAALPYIFTALKVSATASVVGAIIGELPSGISGGLGRAILDFSSDYSLTSTPKLWATIITAAIAGVIFFVVISITEQLVLRRYARSKS